jgi:hypothetical protein
MRRASKLALLSGENAIASETGAVFSTSFQQRWSADLPHESQRRSGKSLPFFVLKSPRTTSVPNLLKLLPDHHQEWRELKTHRGHPRIPTPPSIAQRPRGELSLIFYIRSGVVTVGSSMQPLSSQLLRSREEHVAVTCYPASNSWVLSLNRTMCYLEAC